MQMRKLFQQFFPCRKAVETASASLGFSPAEAGVNGRVTYTWVNSQKVRNSITVLHDLEFARTFVEKEESER